MGKRNKSRLAVILLLSMLFGTVSGAWAEQKPGLYSREIEKAVEYLHKVQNDDGGFPYLPGQDSSQAVSCYIWPWPKQERISMLQNGLQLVIPL